MQHFQAGTLVEHVIAENISVKPPAPVTILSGTRFVVETEKLEWLGREGLYSDITLPDIPGCRLRLRHHQLSQAAGRAGGVFKARHDGCAA